MKRFVFWFYFFGNPIFFERNACFSMQIVSLLPAATEIAAALNAADRLVGSSHECDWPLTVAGLPILTTPKVDASLASGEIDRAVKDAGGGPLFKLDEDLLAELAPDLILTQAACRVCAVDADAVMAAAARIRLPDGRSPRVLTLSPQSLDDLFADMLRVGEAIGRQTEAEAAVAELRHRCDTVRTKAAAALVQAAGRKPRVAIQPRAAIIEWLDPPMAAGNWVPEMLALAGGEDALAVPTTSGVDVAEGNRPAKSHWIDWEAVAAADPDVVLLTPCGFELDRVVSEARSPAVWPHLAGLRATREGRLFAVDGHHLFNRPGPRLVDSLELLAERLHPEAFGFEVTKRFSRPLA
jgi:iron complex transport system substrate-binding protein